MPTDRKFKMKRLIFTSVIFSAVISLLIWATGTQVMADPCGMVPPIYTGDGPPITRSGLQKTYVFYKDGVETFVIRPGFEGKVDEFGMLIPFPSVPAIRKVPDDIFWQISNAIDPPEVVIDLRPQYANRFGRLSKSKAMDEKSLEVAEGTVVVIKREAVGMYEVAVLAAGSPEALKAWMDENGFRYPDGMDKVTGEYIADKWCFVAVKTRVGEKDGVDPKPGQRDVDSKLKPGSVFDGFVQGMGFRFETDELVVPMRLSAFNGGDFHNVVYIMTDGPRKIRNIPEEYVVRQISGKELYDNVTNPLPLRIIGGTEKDLQDWHKQGLKERRDPSPKNGMAKALFAADLMAVSRGELALPHEEQEKQLLQIGEFLRLRGKEIDELHTKELAVIAEKNTASALEGVKEMTLTVVDGNFPREVLAAQNLRFEEFQMAAIRNQPAKYDAKEFGPATPMEGTLIETGAVQSTGDQQLVQANWGWYLVKASVALVCGLSFGFVLIRRALNLGH
jgi:hypothetical protein